MKKLIGVLIIFVFLMVPFYASADIIYDVTLYLTADEHMASESFNSGAWHSYALDIEASSPLLSSKEAFCVENAAMYWGSSKYTLVSLDELYLYPEYNDAANIAEAYYETNKNAAQLAVWETIFDYGDWDLNNGNFRIKDLAVDVFNNAGLDLGSLPDTTNWWLAVNPSNLSFNDDGAVVMPSGTYQDFLVRKSVPEPASMLLFGSALIGLAVIGKKKFKK